MNELKSKNMYEFDEIDTKKINSNKILPIKVWQFIPEKKTDIVCIYTKRLCICSMICCLILQDPSF